MRKAADARARTLHRRRAGVRRRRPAARRSSTPRPANRSARRRSPTPPTSTLRSTAAQPRPARLGRRPMPMSARRILHRAADLIDERIAAIADLLTREQGKPIPDAEKEIRFGVEVIRYYAEEGRRIGGSIRASSRAGRPQPRRSRRRSASSARSRPGTIRSTSTPGRSARRWPPAARSSCKPPHETPLAIGMVVQCFADAGLPAGVLNDMPGTGPEAGAALAAHPDVRMITATASTAAGQSIMRAGADTHEAPVRSNSAASARSSCSTTPTSPKRRPPRRGAPSPTWARSASR